MNYVFFAVSAYIFMRALEVLSAGHEQAPWRRILMRVVAAAVLYSAAAAMAVFYCGKKVHFLGFPPGN